MTKYLVEVFSLDRAGVMVGHDGTHLEAWLQWAVESDYRLVGPCQVTSNDGGIWALATMERDDNESESGLGDP